jgi:hypothetical protein
MIAQTFEVPPAWNTFGFIQAIKHAKLVRHLKLFKQCFSQFTQFTRKLDHQLITDYLPNGEISPQSQARGVVEGPGE